MRSRLWTGAAVALVATSSAFATEPIEDLPARRQFDFWIGEWDVTNKFWAAGRGTAEIPGARLRVDPVLDGHALVEHYRGRGAAGNDILGFSLRAYDPEKEQWVIVLNWPSGNARFWTMEGGFEFNRAVFYGESETPDGRTRLSRYIFSDLIPGFYRWEGSSSFDDGETWARPGYVMEGTRRSDDAEPIDTAWLHGEDISDRCPGQERRALDFTIGEWTGVARRLAEDGSWQEMPTTLTTRPILAGCAVMSQFTMQRPNGGVYEEFDVYAYDSDLGEWVGWSASNRGEPMKRYTGDVDDGAADFFTTLPSGVRERIRRGRDGPDSFSWDGSWSHDGGATWEVLIKGEFRRVK